MYYSELTQEFYETEEKLNDDIRIVMAKAMVKEEMNNDKNEIVSLMEQVVITDAKIKKLIKEFGEKYGQYESVKVPKDLEAYINDIRKCYPGVKIKLASNMLKDLWK